MIVTFLLLTNLLAIYGCGEVETASSPSDGEMCAFLCPPAFLELTEETCKDIVKLLCLFGIIFTSGLITLLVLEWYFGDFGWFRKRRH